MTINYTHPARSTRVNYVHPNRKTTPLVRDEKGTVHLQRGQSVRIA